MDIDSLLQPLDPPPPRTTPPRPRQPWHWHLGQWLSAYLPLLLMALLALGTWWLVQNSPRPDLPRADAPLLHAPDYTMQDFTLQRFGADGRMRVQVQGTQMRHYADTDTLEIDGVTIRALSADGSVTRATARRALANADASEVQLLGAAHVVREAASDGQRVEFESEFLHAFLNTERVRSHLPVTVTRGATQVRADAVEYDHLAGVIRFSGHMRGIFEPRPARP